MYGEVVSLLLVDDHEVVRIGVKGLLELEPDLKVVADVANISDALVALTEHRPDVAVVDLRLGLESGVTLVGIIASRFPATKTIALTSYVDDDLVREVLAAGASGYLLKNVRGPSLAEGIRRVARGERVLDDSALGALLKDPDLGATRRAPMAGISTLTTQEQRVADLVGAGRSNREIATSLGLAEKTVRNYLSNVFVKLDVKSRTELALQLSRTGRND